MCVGVCAGVPVREDNPVDEDDFVSERVLLLRGVCPCEGDSVTGSAPLSECLCDQGVPENEGPFLRPVLGYATQSFLLLCMFHPGSILRGGYVFSGIYLAT